MHVATAGRAERVSRACGWCAQRAQSLLSNWSSRTQFYGAMPNFSYCFEAVGGAVAMAYSGYGRAAYTPGERRLPAAQWMKKAQTCPMFLLLQTKFETPNVH